jgi:hypothetical protein
MRVWTVHARRPAEAEAAEVEQRRTAPRPVVAEPVLVREGFSWLAFLFSGLWFLAHGMWLVLAIYIAGTLLLMALLPEAVAPWAALAVQILVGLHARDLRRWTLARCGWRLAGVVVALDEDAAWARLLAQRPDLARAAAAA